LVTIPLTVRAASPADIDRLQAIREEVAIDLLQRGIRWNPNSTSRQHLERWIDSASVWLALVNDDLAGMVAVWWSDPTDYWPRADLAAYVHDLMVFPRHQRKRIGERLLGWAESYVRGRGRRFIRLDCDADNERLCRYYQDLGYQRMATDSNAALFEKSL
jgi:GNAT superfamily N-acetyltransferase